MPVTSPAQFRFMEAAAHGGLRGAGPSPSVAQDFLDKTPHAQKSAFASAPRKVGRMMGKKKKR